VSPTYYYPIEVCFEPSALSIQPSALTTSDLQVTRILKGAPFSFVTGKLSVEAQDSIPANQA
jgi:hypothetical protein